MSSDEEISSIADDDLLDYDKQDVEDIQFAPEVESDDESQENRPPKNQSIKFQLPPQRISRPLTTLNDTQSKFKPIYTGSMTAHSQQLKQYNFKQKSFNTLPKKSDPVARYQQMSQMWGQSKFLKSTNNSKQGRKLQLDQRIELQKQQLKESGMFHKYVAKSQLFL